MAVTWHNDECIRKKRSVRETFLKRVLEEEKRQERIKRLKNEKEDRNESIIFRSGGEKKNRLTFSQIIGYRERFSYRPLSFPEIRRSFRVFGEPLAGDVSFQRQVVPMFCASTRVHGRLAPLVNDARRRRLSRGAVISSEIPPRGDEAVLVHGATIALCQWVALYSRRLDTVYLPVVLLQRPAVILFRSFMSNEDFSFFFSLSSKNEYLKKRWLKGFFWFDLGGREEGT